MAIEWPSNLYPLELTPEVVLRGWRERIGRVETEESAYLASLPYVRGLCIIGSVGRGDPWPLSDIDMLAVAEVPEGQNIEELLRREEESRNHRLRATGNPNEIEVIHWIVLTPEILEITPADDSTFLRRLEHPHWLGVVIKSQGGRVAHDSTGHLLRFLARCNDVFCTNRFIGLWLRRVVTYCERQLKAAAGLMERGEHMRASVEILRAAYQQFGSGMCAVWREVPQSSARSVTRFHSHAQEAGDHEIQQLFLAACRLEEETVWERYAAVPPPGKQMRDAIWEVRRGAGEILDEVSVTRDMLHVSLWQGVMANTGDEPLPEWTGATADRGMVHRQYVAAHEFLTRLRAEYERTSNSAIVPDTIVH